MSIDRSNRLYIGRMLSCGIPRQTAEDIVACLNRIAARRSALRGEAARGGWLDTDDYVDAFRAIPDGQQLVRASYGHDVFERYLFATMEPNCVVVASGWNVEGGSAAPGLRPGDIIHRFNDERCFSTRELEQRVDGLEPSQVVRLTIRRGAELLSFTVSVAELGACRVGPGYCKPDSSPPVS